MIVAWLVFAAVATAALFLAADGRTATLVALLAGWALLPNQDYPASAYAGGGHSAAVHALAIPAPPYANKATALGLGCLAGLVLAQGPALVRSGRPRWWDVPMIAWCLVPVASALANRLPVRVGLEQARDLALGWGVPYLAGRALFATPAGLRMAARAWEVAGLAAVIPAWSEIAAGPNWYAALYGFHPYRWSGADRTFGHRPLLLFEAGNQYGIWMASAAVAGVWLWATGRREPFRFGRVRVPAWVSPLVLVATSLASQSHAAIVLMVLALVPLAWRGRIGRPGRAAVGLAVGVLAFLAVAAVGWIAVRSGGDPKAAARALFHGVGKSSFTFRLARIADDLPRIAERPALGWGRADWSGMPGGTFVDPIARGVWYLAAGMFGAAGLAASLGVILVPLARGARRLARVDWAGPEWGGAAAALAVLAVHAADLPMNSLLILPVLVIAGGLNAPGTAPEVAPGAGREDARGNMTYRVPGYAAPPKP